MTDGRPLERPSPGRVRAGEPLVWLTVLALALRLIGLNSGLWYDEILTLLSSVRSSLWHIVTVFPGDNQHTFFSVLAHGSIALFGEHAWSLRLPSALAGAATVPFLYLLAREFSPALEARLAALLLAVAYHPIWFSQSARGYAILMLVAVLSTLLLVRGLRRDGGSDFVWYGVVAALGVWTHASMVFLVASHAAACVMPLGLPLSVQAWRRWKRPLLGFAMALAGTAILYAPTLFAVREAVVRSASPMQGATPAWALRELIRGLGIGFGGLVAVAVGSVLGALGLWSYFRQSRFVTAIFLLPGALTVGAAVALSRPVRPRFLVFLAGFGLLVLVRGAMEAGRLLRYRPVGAALVLLVAGASIASLPRLYRLPKQDFVGAMNFVDDHRVAGEPVLTAGPAAYPYREYFHRDWPSALSPTDLAQARTSGRRVWVLYTLETYIQTDTPDLMRSLREACLPVAVFPGTVGGGDVTVCAISPGLAQ